MWVFETCQVKKRKQHDFSKEKKIHDLGPASGDDRSLTSVPLLLPITYKLVADGGWAGGGLWAEGLWAPSQGQRWTQVPPFHGPLASGPPSTTASQGLSFPYGGSNTALRGGCAKDQMAEHTVVPPSTTGHKRRFSTLGAGSR